jgi:hypothetical protein
MDRVDIAEIRKVLPVMSVINAVATQCNVVLSTIMELNNDLGDFVCNR